MAFSSLADELANAFDSPDNDQGGVVSKSLAAEFGLDYDELGGNNAFAGHSGQIFDEELQRVDATDLPISSTNFSNMSSPRGSIGSPSRLKDFDDAVGEEGNKPFEYQMDAVDDSFEPISQSEMITTPLNHPAIKNKVSTRSFRIEGEQDPLVVLSETMAANSKFIASLRHMNESLSEVLVASNSSQAKDKGKSVVLQLQKHLENLVQAERVREEQLRELHLLERELAVVIPLVEGASILKPSPHLDVLIEEKDTDFGWIGEVLADGYPIEKEGATDAEDDLHIEDGDEMINSTDVLHGDALSSLPVPPQTRLKSDTYSANRHLPHLPQQVQNLLSASTDLSKTLAHLSDTLHNSSSLSTWLSRQLRGLRASVKGARERKELEDEACRIVESWERKRVEEGLKGRHDMKETLRLECLEFKEKLEKWGQMMRDRPNSITVF
ncbi:uncharacterized protein L203_105239 [Cryptococcus depauperatus CBS 7841]|uniref:Uncharacterized protein n=1 Tax=Cryptococcus depauperatus CBS 7841 TaxID=1295531 RepID=A0A1E3I0K6_9TREE|nr:hypothetical protein L203_05606 [Cryptococcus depauperatus CBS 7841]